MPKRESRVRRAWRDTKSLENWRWRIVEVLGVLVATFWALRRLSKPEDILENVVLGIAAGVVTLALVPVLEFGIRWLQAGKILAEEQIPLDELRRVISEDIGVPGPQAVSLGGTMKLYGVEFTQKHIAALRTLQANGEVGKVRYRPGIDTDTGEDWFDAIVETTRILHA
jgi:hypothetical protein